MTDLTPIPGWDGVPQLETNTPALGGPGAPMNTQAQALLNRTEQHRLTDAQHGLDTTSPGAVLTPVSVLSDVPSPANALVSSVAQALLNRTKWLEDNGGGGGSGTVTSFAFTDANGISGNVVNPSTTPALTLTLGAITPSSVAASGTMAGSNLSGTNTGDQNVFTTISVAGQPDIVVDSTSDTLTFVAGANITLTTNPGTDSLTIASSGGGGGGTVADGNYGDVTVSSSGTVWNINSGVVTTVELGGDITAAGKALLDDASAAAQRDTMGVVIGTDVAAAGANTDITSVYLNNAGLKLKDTNASHGLIVSPGSDLTADRTLTITTGDTSRTLTMAGNATISGTNTGDQTVTGTASQITVTGGSGATPTIGLPADVLIPTVLTVPNTGLHLLDTNASHDLIISPGSDLTADRTLTVTTGDASRTLTLSANATISNTNTGDQNLFSTISVSGQSDVVADSTSDTLTLVAGSNITITTNAGTDAITIASSGGVADGDKGDITVSSSGAVWTIDNGVVDTVKLGGDITTAGKALLDDANAAAQRSTLGATTVGSNYFTLANPSAITFPRQNADNSLTSRTASELFGDIKQAATTAATGVVELANDGEINSGVVVQGNDKRLYESQIIACSDLTTNITSGTGKAYMPIPYDVTIVEVFAAWVTQQTAGSIFTMDVNVDGSTILSTKITIDNSEASSLTAATQPVISNAAHGKGSMLSVDFDQVGTAGARGVYLVVVWRRT